MFTGIVEETGVAKSFDQGKLWIECGFVDELKIGQSIACNGVCLTVVDVESSHTTSHSLYLESGKGMFCVDVMDETLQRTHMGSTKPGHLINLERSRKIGDRLDGHFVQGHVDTVAQIKHIKEELKNGILSREMCVEIPSHLLKYAVEKGSICLDGISLTLISIQENELTVGIIPHTWEMTNLKTKKEGDVLHVEVDIFAKYVEKLCIQ